MALASKLMADIGEIIGMQESSRKYKETSSILQNNQLLNDWHWSETHGAYLDYGLHSEDVVLQRPKLQNRHQNIPQQVNTVVKFRALVKYDSKKIGLTFGRITQNLLTLQQNRSS